MKHCIFGYGSLVNQEALASYLCRSAELAGSFCYLQGYRRCWNVAMDNRLDLPGYKHYLDAATGMRPAVFVTFLNLRPVPQSMVGGVLFAVTATEMAQLDLRERNYQRIEVTHQLSVPLTHGKAWTYIGTPQAQVRYQEGLRQRRAVVDEAYYQLVHDSFSQCSPAIAHHYQVTTDPPEVPLRKLVKVLHA